MPLCQACTNQHKATKVTEEHSVIPKRDKTLNEQVCELHRFAAIQYYCDDCSKFVCVNCTMLEHRGHQVMGIKEKVTECKLAMEAALKSLDAKISVVNQELRKVLSAEEEIEASRERLKTDINVKVEGLITKIRTQQDSMLQTVDSYMDSKYDFMISRKEFIQSKFDSMIRWRMSNDLNRMDTKDEQFITYTIEAQAKISDWKEEKPMDETEMKQLKVVVTNNVDVGRIESTNKPLFRYKNITFEKLPPPPNMGKYITGEGLADPYDDLVGGLDLYHGDYVNPSASTTRRKDYQKVKVVSKFRTNSFVQKPSGIAVLPNGRFVIADALGHGLVLSDKTGRFQQRLYQDEVSMPQGLCTDKHGHIYVTTDKYVKKFKVGLGGVKVGQFTAFPTPGAIQVNSQGRIVVSDVKAKHVTIYDEEGRALTKFYTTDKTGNSPDGFNLAVSSEHITLSYHSLGLSYYTRVYNYDGELIYSSKIPQKCEGIEMDSFGNMVVASGELVYLATGGQNLLPLTTVDKSGRLFPLNANRVAFTPDGLICTLHINTIARRSEFVVLQMGKKVAVSS